MTGELFFLKNSRKSMIWPPQKIIFLAWNDPKNTTGFNPISKKKSCTIVTDGSVLPPVGGRGSKVMSGVPDLNSFSFVFLSQICQHGSFISLHFSFCLKFPHVHIQSRNFLAVNKSAKVHVKSPWLIFIHSFHFPPTNFPYSVVTYARNVLHKWCRNPGFDVHVHFISFSS